MSAFLRHLLLAFALGVAPVRLAHSAVLPPTASQDLRTGVELLAAKRFPEARQLLEKVATAEPKNAAAAFYLGRTIECRGDDRALPEAIAWYDRAAKLEPENALYLARLGGASLLHAERATSYSAAIRGRDALERALRFDANDLEAREALVQFYSRAPWPLGSRAKAASHLEEVRRQNPDRALVLAVTERSVAKDYAGASRLCEEVLAQTPDNYQALYQAGRVASLSGENLELALSRLYACAKLAPPPPPAPGLALVWYRIGIIEEKLQRPQRAREAYEKSLRLDPAHQPAANRLAALR